MTTRRMHHCTFFDELLSCILLSAPWYFRTRIWAYGLRLAQSVIAVVVDPFKRYCTSNKGHGVYVMGKAKVR
jgi:hypothetical protein